MFVSRTTREDIFIIPSSQKNPNLPDVLPAKDVWTGHGFGYEVSTFGEASSALVAGTMQDALGLSARSVSLVMSGVGGVMSVMWFAYQRLGGGAASEETQDFLLARKAQPRKQGDSEQTPLLSRPKPTTKFSVFLESDVPLRRISRQGTMHSDSENYGSYE